MSKRASTPFRARQTTSLLLLTTKLHWAHYSVMLKLAPKLWSKPPGSESSFESLSNSSLTLNGQKMKDDT